MLSTSCGMCSVRGGPALLPAPGQAERPLLRDLWLLIMKSEEDKVLCSWLQTLLPLHPDSCPSCSGQALPSSMLYVSFAGSINVLWSVFSFVWHCAGAPWASDTAVKDPQPIDRSSCWSLPSDKEPRCCGSPQKGRRNPCSPPLSPSPWPAPSTPHQSLGLESCHYFWAGQAVPGELTPCFRWLLGISKRGLVPGKGWTCWTWLTARPSHLVQAASSSLWQTFHLKSLCFVPGPVGEQRAWESGWRGTSCWKERDDWSDLRTQSALGKLPTCIVGRMEPGTLSALFPLCHCLALWTCACSFPIVGLSFLSCAILHLKGFPAVMVHGHLSWLIAGGPGLLVGKGPGCNKISLCCKWSSVSCLLGCGLMGKDCPPHQYSKTSGSCNVLSSCGAVLANTGISQPTPLTFPRGTSSEQNGPEWQGWGGNSSQLIYAWTLVPTLSGLSFQRPHPGVEGKQLQVSLSLLSWFLGVPAWSAVSLGPGAAELPVGREVSALWLCHLWSSLPSPGLPDTPPTQPLCEQVPLPLLFSWDGFKTALSNRTFPGGRSAQDLWCLM